jgi:hypothetical protein
LQADEAVREYRASLALEPDSADTLCNLGRLLADAGFQNEGLALLRRGHELGLKRPDWKYSSADWVRKAEQEVFDKVLLLAFLKGGYQPRDNAERLGLIAACRARTWNHAAARLYGDVLAVDPGLREDLRAAHRYHAAAVAALTAAREGADAAKLNYQECARWRNLALAWLRADLNLWAKQLDGGGPQDRAAARKTLRQWQENPDLAGVRDPEALAELPAPQRDACRKLWADVAALLQKSNASK